MLGRRALLGGVAVVVVGVAAVAVLWMRPPRSGATHESRAAAFPLVQLEVTTRSYAVPEIFAALHPRVRLVDVVAIAVFGGFEAGLSPERALQQHGKPAGHWVDPVWGSDSPYYETPLARTSLGQFFGSDGKPAWKTVAYPSRSSLAEVVVSEPLRRQLSAALPAAGEADVVIARPIGAGRVELFMTRTNCRAVMWLEEGS